jgi:hypothetical protein
MRAVPDSQRRQPVKFRRPDKANPAENPKQTAYEVIRSRNRNGWDQENAQNPTAMPKHTREVSGSKLVSHGDELPEKRSEENLAAA